MSLIVTPGLLERRAELYHQIGAGLEAGLPLLKTLEFALRTPSFRRDRSHLSRLIHALNQGHTFGEAIVVLGGWMPEFDRALVSAGEQSGRLDSCLRRLSEYYRERARLARSVLSDLAYPLFILHLAVLIFPPAMLKSLIWDGEIVGFVGAKLAQLIPLYVLVFAGLVALQGSRAEAWRAWIERAVACIPLVGRARRELALARLSLALGGLISAGVSIVTAWELAAVASGSPALRRTVAGWRPDVDAGTTPAEMVARSGAFPELFSSLYHSGEVSGQLDQSLHRIYRHYQEEGSRRLHLAAQWMPRMVYIALLLMVGYQVVAFWTNYYGNLLNQF